MSTTPQSPPTPTIAPDVAEFLAERRAERRDNPMPGLVTMFVREHIDPMTSETDDAEADFRFVVAMYALAGMAGEGMDVSGLLLLATRTRDARRAELVAAARSAS